MHIFKLVAKGQDAYAMQRM